jgi:hypothetical protein
VGLCIRPAVAACFEICCSRTPELSGQGSARDALRYDQSEQVPLLLNVNVAAARRVVASAPIAEYALGSNGMSGPV